MYNVVLFVQLHGDDHGQSVDACSKRTEVVGQFRRQHRQNGVGQVNRRRTGCGGAIQCRAGLNVVGHVGDGDPERSQPSILDQADGVVEILGVGRIDGHKRKVAQVGAPALNLGVSVHVAQQVSMVDKR